MIFNHSDPRLPDAFRTRPELIRAQIYVSLGKGSWLVFLDPSGGSPKDGEGARWRLYDETTRVFRNTPLGDHPYRIKLYDRVPRSWDFSLIAEPGQDPTDSPVRSFSVENKYWFIEYQGEDQHREFRIWSVETDDFVETSWKNSPFCRYMDRGDWVTGLVKRDGQKRLLVHRETLETFDVEIFTHFQLLERPDGDLVVSGFKIDGDCIFRVAILDRDTGARRVHDIDWKGRNYRYPRLVGASGDHTAYLRVERLFHADGFLRIDFDEGTVKDLISGDSKGDCHDDF